MPTQPRPRQLWLLFMIVAVAVVPALFKPPHIDEESYLFIGEAVASSPLHPYHWWRAWQPFASPAQTSYLYAHPPLFLEWIAACGGLVGFDAVPALRLLQLGWVGLLVASVFSLARRLTAHPVLATAAVLMAPGPLLVMQQSLMIDLMPLALGCAALAVLWPGLSGDEPASWRDLVGGGLWGLACLAKYPALVFGLAIVAVAVTAGPGARARAWRPIAVGLCLFVLWQLASALVYGEPHLWVVLSHASEIARTPLPSRLAAALSHVGVAVLSAPLALAAALAARHRLRWAVALIGGALAVVAVGWGVAQTELGSSGPLLDLLSDAGQGLPPSLLGRGLLAVFWALGGLTMGLLISALRSGRRPEDRALATWALLAVFGVALTHNFIGARYLTLASVPLGLLAWRFAERGLGAGKVGRWGVAVVALTALISGGVSLADLRWARAYAPLALRADGVVSEHLSPGGAVWFAGAWAARYEAERRSWRRLDADQAPASGDLVVIAEGSAPEVPFSRAAWQVISTLRAPDQLLSTHAPGQGVGFYSDAFGLLPFGPAQGPMDVLSIYQVPRGPGP